MNNTVETILADLETKTLKARLREYPALIRRQKSIVSEKRQALEDAKTVRQTMEAEMVAVIATEMNGNTGKPKFSNAEARAAELISRKRQNPACQEAEKVCREAEWALNEAQFELEKLIDEFKAYRYVVDLTARELALLATGIAEEETLNKEPY